MSWCHLCNRIAEEEFYIEHLRIYHPTTLFVMYAVNLTPASMNYVNTFPFYMDESDDDDEYESLLALCNEIGDHKIGIEDITTVSSVVDRATLNFEDTCPICLEMLIEIEDDIYTLDACAHSYCKECIETWCLENKNCPVCKSDITNSSQPAFS